ncbi:MAG: ABC transporter ATP-binding protein, partial [Euryarchaeota archaeon]|nr:ABC transporter ATP-binding protein [Euryarchaeota archaeon]
TVILTTHYIDEAGKADRVGLMRNGRLLAEKSPIELMDEYDTNSLEDVFLTLCKREVIA